MPDDGELELLVDGKRLSGWQEIRVTRGVERAPSDFDIGLTERYPGELEAYVARVGSPCEVRIGGDPVVTGFIDRYCPSLSGRSHAVQVMGRGKCQDLVDCSAYLRGDANQVNEATTRALVEKLCALFGIEVRALAGDGEKVPQFNVILTETCWDIIDRVCRHSGFLAYEGADGNLILARAGKTKMASGFREGLNVERAAAAYSMDQRFSLYEVVWMSLETMYDVGAALGGDRDPNRRIQVRDVTVGADRPGTGRRFRPRVIVSDQEQAGRDIAEQRATWERNRRNGRARSVRITADSWRDSKGRLWEPNCLTPVHLPTLKVDEQEWLIGEVTYARGRDGTHADLLLMPPDAYEPEPIVLLPFDAQVYRALNPPAGASP